MTAISRSPSGYRGQTSLGLFMLHSQEHQPFGHNSASLHQCIHIMCQLKAQVGLNSGWLGNLLDNTAVMWD